MSGETASAAMQKTRKPRKEQQRRERADVAALVDIEGHGALGRIYGAFHTMF